MSTDFKSVPAQRVLHRSYAWKLWIIRTDKSYSAALDSFQRFHVLFFKRTPGSWGIFYMRSHKRVVCLGLNWLLPEKFLRSRRSIFIALCFTDFTWESHSRLSCIKTARYLRQEIRIPVGYYRACNQLETLRGDLVIDMTKLKFICQAAAQQDRVSRSCLNKLTSWTFETSEWRTASSANNLILKLRLCTISLM